MGRLAVLLLLLLALVSCSGQTAALDTGASAGAQTAVQSVKAPQPSPPTLAPVPGVLHDVVDLWPGFVASEQEGVVLAGLTLGEVNVYEEAGSGEVVRTLPATTILGTATVVSAIGQPTEDGWVEVLLPG